VNLFHLKALKNIVNKEISTQPQLHSHHLLNKATCSISWML